MHYNATGTKVTAFFFSSFWYHMYLDALDGRGGITVAKEKVASSLYYSNRVLLSAKFSYLGLPRGVIFYILAYYRQIRRTFLAYIR
ncbi:hypothetical protein GE21DRAFT_1220855 [Neurospora crassa]|nr:hypothetical protein GE21DRAFT_1220855 [Neurospora crassa]